MSDHTSNETPHPFDDVDGDEARAIVDALALAVYADQEINEEEEAEIVALVRAMKWAWAEPLLDDGYVTEALDQAEKIVEDDDGVKEAARDIAERLHDGRYVYLFEMLARIVAADREVTYAETDFMLAFSEAFDIPPPVAADIVDHAERVRELED